MGHRVEVKLKADPGADRTLGGAQVELLAAGFLERRTTDVTGMCRFDDVEPGAYEVRVAEPPSFYTATTAGRPVTVGDQDVTEELAVGALWVKVTVSGFTQTGFRRPRVEIRSEANDVVASAEVGAAETVIPIPRAGTYAVVQSVAGEGCTEPPADEKKIVVLSATTPTSQVDLVQKKLALAISIIEKKKVDGTVSEVPVTGGRVTVRGPQGGAPSDHELPAEVPVQRTGKHTVALTDVPEPYVVAAATQEPRIEWGATASISVKFEAVAQERKSIRAIVVSWGLVSFVVLAGLISSIVAIPALRDDRWKGIDAREGARLASVGAGLLAVGLALALVTLAGRNRRGLLTPLIGADGRMSTSRVAPALWTTTIAFVLIHNASRRGWDGEALARTLEPHWDDYLILLGGPFAAAVLAKAVVQWKVVNGTLQKTEAADGPAVGQVVQDDAGNTSLVDAQYLVFNAIALVFFWVAFVESGPKIPKIPNLLLALTSGAAAIYVSNKAVEENKPVITGLSPGSVRPGETFVIGGQHFLPTTKRDASPVVVTLEGVGPLDVVGKPRDDHLTVRVPPAVSAGVRNVTLTTSARVTTEPRRLEVLGDEPTVLGVTSGLVLPGEAVRVIGTHLRSALDEPTTPVLVGFGDKWVTAVVAQGAGGEEAVSVAPRDLVGDSVLIRFRTARGATSSPISVPLPRAPDLLRVTATREGTDKVRVTAIVRNALASTPAATNAPKVLVDTQPAELIAAGAFEGAQDRLVAIGPLGADAKSVAVIVVDHQGRQSLPGTAVLS